METKPKSRFAKLMLATLAGTLALAVDDAHALAAARQAVGDESL